MNDQPGMTSRLIKFFAAGTAFISLWPGLSAAVYGCFGATGSGAGIPPLVFYWWIASLANAVVVTPVLFLVGLGIVCRILFLRDRPDKSRLLAWMGVALLLAIAGELATAYFLPKSGC